MSAKEMVEVVVLLKGFISYSFRRGKTACDKDELPRDVRDNMPVVLPFLHKWEEQGFIKFNNTENKFFEIIKDIT